MTFLLSNYSPEPDEIWKSYKAQIEVLNECYNRRTTEAGVVESKDPELDRLLDPKSGLPGSYLRLYAAEQRLAKLMPDYAIIADAASKFADAKHRGLQSEPGLRAVYDATTDMDQKRAIHFALMDDLQFYYLQRDRNRRVRHSRARLLNFIGAIIIVPTVVISGRIYLSGNLASLGHFHLFVILWFGLLGAYFSRMITFQRSYLSLDHEALMSEYSIGSILVRLIIGTMGSLMMYLFIRGEMIGGELFPSWDDMTFIDRATVDGDAKQVVRQAVENASQYPTASEPPPEMALSAEIVAPEPLAEPASALPPPEAEADAAAGQLSRSISESKSVQLVSKDYAQLLIWSALAGFSERLIPDRFTALETDANKGAKSVG